MNEEQIKAHIAKLKATQKALWGQKEPLDKALLEVHHKLQKGYDDLAKAKVTEMQARGEIDWAYLLRNDTGTEAYRTLGVELLKLSLSNSGYFHQTNQRCISFGLYKKDDDYTIKVEAGIRTIFPYLLPLPDGYVHIDFMEKSLSEYGSYDLYLKQDLTGYINKRTYGSDSKVFEGDLTVLLAYIQQNLYYAKKT